MLPERRAPPDRTTGRQAGRARGRRSRDDARARSPTSSRAPASRSRASSTCASRAAAARRDGQSRPARARSRSTATPIDCDLLVASGGRQPAYSLLAQAGARVEYEPRARHLRPDRRSPPGVEAVGSRHRRAGAGAVPPPSYGGGGDKCFVCVCEDVTREGPEARDRRGLRLDRAREALHDGDDGPVPGEALPPRRRSGCSRARRAPARRRSARRPRGRRGSRSSSACSPAATTSRAKRSPLHYRHEQAGAR